MGFKKIGRSLDFADVALSSSSGANHSVKLMEKISASINRLRIETVLLQHYTVGTTSKAQKHIRFKCLRLQKWFRSS